MQLPEEVTFLGDAGLYATPAGAIEAYRQEFERYMSAGAEQIRIAGDVPHEGNEGRFAGWDRYESAVNAVWEDYPVWSRCLYDATTVPAAVRDVVERTHRRLVAPDGSAAPSPRYQEVQDFRALPPPVDPLEATSPDVSLVDTSLNRTRSGSPTPSAAGSTPGRTTTCCSRCPRPCSTPSSTDGHL